MYILIVIQHIAMSRFVLDASLFSTKIKCVSLQSKGLQKGKSQRWSCGINTLRPRQHGRHFADDTFKRILMTENVINLTKISLKFVPKGPINNIPALVQIMAWRQPGDKPLSEAMMVRLLTHICVARPQ